MADFKTPLRDIYFNYFEMFGLAEGWKSLPKYAEVDQELATSVLEALGKFADRELAPLNRVGDEEGCQWSNGHVATPTGFKEAYKKYIDDGWPSLAQSPEWGGQGLPASLGLAATAIFATANHAWGMYPGLSHGAMETIETYGTQEQKTTYLTKLISGAWTGTMCLTESHCGTDLGLLRTKAEPCADGSYSISGTKIFISAGEHDMSENIIHIVLARLPDAPAGTRGISLFIVPKLKISEDGSAGENNHVHCGSIEAKMGIHGNATCVLNFEGAAGYMISEPNRGLRTMFTFMNAARVGVGIEGMSHAENGFQLSLNYARERLQMRSLSGPKNKDGPADPIIVHPDVRRMLLTQKSFAEGCRMLVTYCARLLDQVAVSENELERKLADTKLSFLTPILKAFSTEVGHEAANLGVQCFGGHGYIREWGAEQNVRDVRISMLYEGTTGIQALDLLGRKVLGSQGELMKPFVQEVQQFCMENTGHPVLGNMVGRLSILLDEWSELTMSIGGKAMSNPDEVGAASVDYLMYSGYVVLAYFWARAALLAENKLADEAFEDDGFYQAKLQTATFYFERILPRTNSLAETMVSGAENLMMMNEAHFCF